MSIEIEIGKTPKECLSCIYGMLQYWVLRHPIDTDEYNHTIKEIEKLVELIELE